MIALITLRRIDWVSSDFVIGTELLPFLSRTDIHAVIYNDSSTVDVLSEIAGFCTLKTLGIPLLLIDVSSESKQSLLPIASSLGCDIYPDGSFLEDADVLSYLVETYNQSSELTLVEAQSRSLSLIQNFAARFLEAYHSGDALVLKDLKKSTYLTEFCTATLDMRNKLLCDQRAQSDLAQHTLNLLTDVESRAQMWSRTELEQSTLITQLKTDLQLLQQENDLRKKNVVSRSSTLQYFPTYNLSPNVTVKILLVKEYSTCLYLTSFLYCYARYLLSKWRLRCRFLIAHQNLDIIELKYSGMPTLTPASLSTSDLRGENLVYASSEPTKEVLDKLFVSCDIVIVLDRTFRSTAVVAGKSVVRFNAFGSISDIRRYTSAYNLPMSSAIQSIGMGAGLESTLYIPFITGYLNASEMSRELLYLSQAKDLYLRLDACLGVR